MKTALCKRCGVPGRGEPNPDSTARPFRKAACGHCTACAVVLFFQDEDSMGLALPPDFDPEGLRLPHVQQQFAKVLAVGNSELQFADIDWGEVIRKWRMP
jgi:hypothetical protein